MGEVIIIEVHNRISAHISHLKFSRTQVRIGRAYDNDVIISDPYISPYHAIIERTPEGQFLLIDSGSTNGIYLHKNKKVDGQAVVNSGDRVNLGKTILRVFDSAHEVSPAIVMTPQKSLFSKLALPFYAGISFIITFIVMVLMQFIDSSNKIKLVSLLSSAIPLLFIPLVWAGIWAFAGYLLRRGAQFSLQYILANSALAGIVLSTIATEYIDYYSINSSLSHIIVFAAITLISTALLFGNISIASGTADLKRFIITISIVGLIAGTVALSENSASLENKISPKYSRTLKPPYASVIKTVSLDDYTKECEKLFAKH